MPQRLKRPVARSCPRAPRAPGTPTYASVDGTPAESTDQRVVGADGDVRLQRAAGCRRPRRFSRSDSTHVGAAVGALVMAGAGLIVGEAEAIASIGGRR